MSFERYLQNEIPLQAAADFFIKLKYAENAVAPQVVDQMPDPSMSEQMPEPVARIADLARAKLELSTMYQVYSESLRDPTNTAMGEHFKEHAKDQLEHADYLVRRAAVIHGPVEMGPIQPPPPSTDLHEILSTIMEAERAILGQTQELHQLVGENPMKYELEAMMVLTQHHFDDMMQHVPEEPVAEEEAPAPMPVKTAELHDEDKIKRGPGMLGVPTGALAGAAAGNAAGKHLLHRFVDSGAYDKAEDASEKHFSAAVEKAKERFEEVKAQKRLGQPAVSGDVDDARKAYRKVVDGLSHDHMGRLGGKLSLRRHVPVLAGAVAGGLGARHLMKKYWDHGVAKDKMRKAAADLGLSHREVGYRAFEPEQVGELLGQAAGAVAGAGAGVYVSHKANLGPASSTALTVGFGAAAAREGGRIMRKGGPIFKSAAETVDPDTMSYLQQEQDAMQAQEEAEQGYFRERFQAAAAQLQQAQEQMQAQQAQIEQLQGQVQEHEQNSQQVMQQAQQTNQMATQTAQQAHAVASQAVQQNQVQSQELIQQMQLSANMRSAIDQMKQQVMEVAMQPSPPATTMQQAFDMTAPQMQDPSMPGGDPNAPQDPNAAAQDPNAAAQGQQPQQPQQAQQAQQPAAAPAKKAQPAQKTASARHVVMGLGALAGGAVGAHQSFKDRSASKEDAEERVRSEESKQEQGVGKVMDLARARMHQAGIVLAKNNPRAYTTMMTGIGAGAGLGMARAGTGAYDLLAKSFKGPAAGAIPGVL